MAIASLVGVVVSTLLGLLVSRGLIKPLVDLEHVASEMRDGNYEIRSPIFKPSELASCRKLSIRWRLTLNRTSRHAQVCVGCRATEIRTPLTSLRADLNPGAGGKKPQRKPPFGGTIFGTN
jgi:signal transduction histidine kinase